jgi:hypothetical protein
VSHPQVVGDDPEGGPVHEFRVGQERDDDDRKSQAHQPALVHRSARDDLNDVPDDEGHERSRFGTSTPGE